MQKKDGWETFWTWVAIFFIIGLVGMAYEWVVETLDNRNSKKERCINETYNIKNEFTAKQKYKACMRR